MAEYIDREALIKEIASQKMVSVVPNCYEPKIKKAVCSLGQAIKAIIKNHPTADVVEVRNGRWQEERWCDNFQHTCSLCNKTARVHPQSVAYKYCPYCGARMDGKDGADERMDQR